MGKKRANGEGTFWYDKGRARWEARATITDERGELVRRKVTGKTKAEASARLRELLAATEQGIQPARRDLSVSAYLSQWLTSLRGTVAPGTEDNYRRVVELYVRPHVGRKRLTTLSPTDVSNMVRKLEEAGLSPNTQRLARSVLRRALRKAEQEGLLMRNVASIADGVRVGTREGRTLTPEQARTLLGSLDGHRLEAAYTVALALGLRRGELLGLTWADIDLEAPQARLTVRRALKRLTGHRLLLEDTKTLQSRRTVFLPSPVADALRQHRKRQLEERLAAGPLWVELPLDADLVFRTSMGTAMDPDNFRQDCYRVTERALGERWSPHELRHSAASLLLAMGVPLEVVSETLGHSSIRITKDVYGHLLEPAHAEAANAMERALWGTA